MATNLAWMAAAGGRDVAYVDCDAEEPNGHLFLKPTITQQRPIHRLIPEVDLDRCMHCGQCGQVCQYRAIVCIGKHVLVYPELCHGCGGCALVCPTGAIHEAPRPMGLLTIGTSGAVRFVEGVLNVGEHKSPPAIRAVKQAAPAAELVILDAPAGTSCPVVETVRGCDLVLLVTEPTPFGWHDLKLACKMVQALRVPFAVVINRCQLGDDEVDRSCAEQGIPVLGRIADDRAVAEAYSRGEMASLAVPDFREHLRGLIERLFRAHVA